MPPQNDIKYDIHIMLLKGSRAMPLQQPMEMEGRPAHSTINHGPISTLRLDRIWVSLGLGIKGAANQ